MQDDWIDLVRTVKKELTPVIKKDYQLSPGIVSPPIKPEYKLER